MMKRTFITLLLICLFISLAGSFAFAQSGTYEAPPARSEEPTYNIAAIDTLDLKIGNTAILVVTPEPSGTSVTWSSSNDSVASISAIDPTSARVTAIGPGTARIISIAVSPKADGTYWRESTTVTVTSALVTPPTGGSPAWPQLILAALAILAAPAALAKRRAA
jgi:hypothetical protein